MSTQLFIATFLAQQPFEPEGVRALTAVIASENGLPDAFRIAEGIASMNHLTLEHTYVVS